MNHLINANRPQYFRYTHFFCTVLLVGLLVTLMSRSTQAAEFHWIGTTGDWSDPANWGGTAPDGDDVYIDNGGTVFITQQGEFCTHLYLGNGAGTSGTIQMVGGSFVPYYVHLGIAGSGAITQSAGTATMSFLYLGENAGTGIYNLSGSSQLTVESEYIGFSGTGTFTQSGGTNTLYSDLYLGVDPGSTGKYVLTSGQLSSRTEYIGNNHTSTGLFQQSDGSNTTDYLLIDTNGTYELSGGTLQINSGLDNAGTLDLASKSAVINIAANSLVNLIRPGGKLLNTQSATLTIGPNSLLIIPDGFDPNSAFAHYSNAGTVHIMGTPLSISSSNTISCWGNIDDHVDCQGTLVSLTDKSINLNTGLMISGKGNVNLGSGTLQIEDTVSGNAGGTLSTKYFYVGKTGTGSFSHSAGSNTILNTLYVGYDVGSTGTYVLSGTGQLDSPFNYIGYSGEGVFNQTGNTTTTTQYGYLFIGYNAGAKGLYTLSDNAQLNNYYEAIGVTGTGVFQQTGGTNTMSYCLTLGVNAGSVGTYALSGNGILSAASEYVGYDPAAVGLFQQTGGMNSTTYLSIGSGGKYFLSGGTLQINGGLDNGGTLDFTSGPATLNAASNSLVNLARPGSFLKNTEAATLTVGANSLLIIPSGFNPATAFAHYSNSGLTHIAGTPLVIAAGQGFSGMGTIDDPVDCQGTISGGITFNGSLTISGSGNVNIKNSFLNIDNSDSGMNGGSLTVGYQNVGAYGTGVFTQSAGTNTASYVNVGTAAGSTGTYYLSGTSQLTAYGEQIGTYGTGTFIQSGGTNKLLEYGELELGYLAGSSGTYILSGTGQLSTYTEHIGGYGNGTFIQSGGTNIATGVSLGSASGSKGYYNQTGGTSKFGGIAFGMNPGSSGTYDLSGTGQLVTSGNENIWTGSFNQSGDTTNTISGSLYLGCPDGLGGTYTLTGGHLSTAQDEKIGSSSTGIFLHSNGFNNVAGSLYLGYFSGVSGTYSLSMTGQLSVTKDEYVGYSGTGLFNHSDGTNSINGSLYIGYNAGANGVYNLSGGQLSASAEYIGGSNSAVAQFQQSGGVNTTTSLTIGINGQYKLTAGTLQINGGLDNAGTLDCAGGSASINATQSIINLARPGSIIANSLGTSLIIGDNSLLIVPVGFDPATAFAHYSNSGIVHVAGTPLIVPSGVTVKGCGSIDDPVICQGTILGSTGGTINFNRGINISGEGIVNFSGSSLPTDDLESGISGGSLMTATHYVGKNGVGIFTQTGGTNSISDSLYLGYNAGSKGTYYLNGTGQLSVATKETIGYSGNGYFIQSGGVNTITNVLNLGGLAGSSGSYELSGTGRLSAKIENIGVGTGFFTHTNGINAISDTLNIGYNRNSEGTYNLSGSGQLTVTKDEYIGYYGKGTMIQSGGTNTVSNQLYIGGTGGTYTLSDSGQLIAAKDEYVGYYENGTFNQTGGINTVAGTLYLGSASESIGTYNLTGGILKVKAIVKNTSGSSFNLGGGTIQASNTISTSLSMNLTGIGGPANIDTAGYSVQLSGLLSGTGGINKLGNSSLTLKGSNTYSGGTTVNGGSLFVNNSSGSGTGTGAVTVNSGGTLSGTGKISGTVSVNAGGTLAPGAPVGILTVNNQITFQSGATLSVEVKGLTAGTGYDQLRTTGPASLAGSLTLSFSSFTATDNNILFLINNTGSGATTGTFQFADNTKVGTFNGRDWYITYDADNAVTPCLDGGNDVAIYTVPEPGMFVLLSSTLFFSLFLVTTRKLKSR